MMRGIRRLSVGVLSLFALLLLYVNAASAAPTWTVNSLDSTGCNSGDVHFTVTFAGITGAEFRRTQADSGGLRYMDEDAGAAVNETRVWQLFNNGTGGPITGTWPIPSNQPVTVNFMLTNGAGGPTVYWRQVTLSKCNGGSLVSDVVIIGSGSPYCDGFSDVPAGAGYCPSVDWLKNRAITLGCVAASPTSPTPLYCPNDPVTRAQMAQFMNRMGNALTPTVYTPYTWNINQAGFANPSLSNVYCQQSISAASYPRRVVFSGGFGAKSTGANGNVRVLPEISFDGGATWSSFGNDAFIDQYINTATPSNVQNVGSTGLPAGKDAIVGAYLNLRTAGPTGFTGECQSIVQVINAISASAPFDAESDPQH
jgi:hypothetical protein